MGLIATAYDQDGNVIGIIVISSINQATKSGIEDDVLDNRVTIRALIPCDSEIARVELANGISYAVYKQTVEYGPGYCQAILLGELE
jgi:hypothetical protein